MYCSLRACKDYYDVMQDINLDEKKRRINQKAPASPHTTRAGGVRSGRAPGQSEGERGRQESGETDEVEESEMNVSKLNANSYELSSTDDYRLPCNKYTQNTGDKVQ